jgi:hypothetical protein
MSIGASLLQMMGKQDPRQRLVDRLLAAQQPVASAPYAAAQADPAAMVAATTEPEGGAYATQEGIDNPIVHKPPPKQAEAYTSPEDLSGMYKELMDYNSRAQNLDRGIALLGSAFAHPENRANIINSFTGGSTVDMDPAKMVELAQGIQKSETDRATMAAQMAQLPAIAEKYGLDLPTAQMLLQSGQLDDLLLERGKEKPQIITNNGESIGIDVRTGKEMYRVGVPDQPDLEFQKVGDDLHMINKKSGETVRTITSNDPDYLNIEDSDGTTMIVDKKNPTKVIARLGTPKKPSSDDTIEYDVYVGQQKAKNEPAKSFEEWILTTKRAGANQTNVTVGGEKKFQEKLGEEQAKRYVEFQNQAESARKQKAQYDIAEKALTSGLYTGFGADLVHSARKAGDAFGMDVDKDAIAAGDVFKSVQNQLAMMKRNPDSGLGLPGSVSDRDLQFLKDADINMTAGPEGNRVMIKMARAIANRNEVVANMAAKHIEEFGQLDAKWDQKLKEYADNNPLFEGIEIKTLTPEEKLRRAKEKFGLN